MIHFSAIKKPPRHALELLPTHIRTERIAMRTPRRRRGNNGTYPTVRGTPRFLVTTKRNQRCVVKVSYAKNTASRSWAAHGAYLQREHAQSLGERGHGFNFESNELDIKLTLREWQQAGDPHLFKFIVSPENGDRMNLQQHAKNLVREIEKDLQTSLQWIAIDHHNTDHPHVHIAVRGLDDRGNTLLIDSHYLTHEIRHQSEELATRELGLRRELDITRSLERQIEREHVTVLDHSIQYRMDREHTVSYDTPVPDHPRGRQQRLLEIQRLKFLEDLGLAQRIDTKIWRLDDNFERSLQELQRAHDIRDAFTEHHARSFSHELPTPTTIELDHALTGKVIGMGLENELHDQRYLILEDTNGHAHYIQATNSIVKAHDRFEFGKGDTITLELRSFVNEHEQTIEYIKVHRELSQQLEQQITREMNELEHVPEIQQQPERSMDKQIDREQTLPEQKIEHSLELSREQEQEQDISKELSPKKELDRELKVEQNLELQHELAQEINLEKDLVPDRKVQLKLSSELKLEQQIELSVPQDRELVREKKIDKALDLEIKPELEPALQQELILEHKKELETSLEPNLQPELTLELSADKEIGRELSLTETNKLTDHEPDQENTLIVEKGLQLEPGLRDHADQQLEQLLDFKNKFLELHPERALSLEMQLMPHAEKLAREWQLHFKEITRELSITPNVDALQKQLEREAHELVRQPEIMRSLESFNRDLAQETRELAQQHERMLQREQELKKELDKKLEKSRGLDRGM